MTDAPASHALFGTARTVVRRLAVADAAAMHAVYGDAEAMRYVDDGAPLPLAECERWIRVTERNVRERGYGMAAVVARDAPEAPPIGFCGLVHPNGQVEAELKYALHRSVWGRGYGREVAAGMLVYGLGPLRLPTVIATVDEEHAASRRILEAIGMRVRGVREVGGRGVVTYEAGPPPARVPLTVTEEGPEFGTSR